MRKRSPFVAVFLIVLFIAIAFFIVGKAGLLKPIEPITQVIIAPIQASIYSGWSAITSFGSNSKLVGLQNQNTALIKQLVTQEKLIKDNQALRDQFETKDIKSTNLIPARVVGAPGFLPGFSVPEDFILDKGDADGIKVGDAIIYKDNLIGRVSKTTQYLSNVQLISNSLSSFTAQTLETGALGVVKGQGGGSLILDNVILSDTLKSGDVVITKGSVEQNGSGLVPDLVVGKITAISKSPSDLFQRAKIESMVDFSHISTVFIVNLR